MRLTSDRASDEIEEDLVGIPSGRDRCNRSRVVTTYLTHTFRNQPGNIGVFPITRDLTSRGVNNKVILRDVEIWRPSRDEVFPSQPLNNTIDDWIDRSDKLNNRVKFCAISCCQIAVYDEKIARDSRVGPCTKNSVHPHKTCFVHFQKRRNLGVKLSGKVRRVVNINRCVCQAWVCFTGHVTSGLVFNRKLVSPEIKTDDLIDVLQATESDGVRDFVDNDNVSTGTTSQIDHIAGLAAGESIAACTTDECYTFGRCRCVNRIISSSADDGHRRSGGCVNDHVSVYAIGVNSCATRTRC